MPIRPLNDVYKVSIEERNNIQNWVKDHNNLPKLITEANRLIKEANYPLALNMLTQALKQNPQNAENLKLRATILKLRATIYIGCTMPELEKLELPSLIQNNTKIPDSTLSDLTHLANLVKRGVRDLSQTNLVVSPEESKAIARLKGFMNFVSDKIVEKVRPAQARVKVLFAAGERIELSNSAKKIFDNALKAIGLATQPTPIMHNLVATYGFACVTNAENLSPLEKNRILSLSLKHAEIAERKFMDKDNLDFDKFSAYYAKAQIYDLKQELLPEETRQESFKLADSSRESSSQTNYDKALEQINQAIELNPHNSLFFRLRADITASKAVNYNNSPNLNSELTQLIKAAIEDYEKAKSMIIPDTQNFESIEKSVASLKENLHFIGMLENSLKEKKAFELLKAGSFKKALNLAKECSQFDHERYEGFNLLANVILSELEKRYRNNTLQSSPDSVNLIKEGHDAVTKALKLFPPRDSLYSQEDINEIRSSLQSMNKNFLFLKRTLGIEIN